MTTDPSTLSREEIARCVAVEVMGWTLPTEFGILYKDGRQSWGQSPEYTISKFKNYERQGIAERLLERPDLGGWDPAENIAHAWQVVERMKERGMQFTLGSAGAGCGYQACFAVITANEPRVFLGNCAEPARAICLAALRAVRGGV